MALITFNAGAQEIARRALNYSATGDVKLKLYQSNTTLSETTVIGDLTIATWTGYADITLTGASWTVTSADPASASYAKQTFTSSAGSQSQANYGYVVTNSAGTIALWGETFSDGPYTIVNNGDKIEVTPVWTLD
jgi:hypothetical protein